MHRNHHFDFGRDKTEFRSTFDANFTAHNIKGTHKHDIPLDITSNQLLQTSKNSKILTLKCSSPHISSIPLSHYSSQKFLKVGASIKPTSDALKSLKYYIPTTSRADKEKTSFTLGIKNNDKKGHLGMDA